MAQAEIAARNEAAAQRPGFAAVARARRAKILRPVLMLGGVVLVALATLGFWLMGGGYVSSDDAYVDGAKVSLSTDVSGLVGQVYVRDNQHVVAGQELFELSQTGFGLAVDAARAQLAQAALDVNAARRGYAEAVAEITAQQVQVAKDAADLRRYGAVVGNGGVMRATYDDARFALSADQAKLAQLQAAAGLQLVKLSGNADIPVEQTPEYRNALAQLNLALTNQKDSVVRAPFSGTVTQVEQLQPGMFLAAGTAAFGLVSDTDVYVTAQPKENDLTWVRAGQSVTITLDTYPGQRWKGVVQSLSPASGAEFAILPAQNSSGNWVKVVQRIPLRIEIVSGPAGLPLRDGMSTEVSIDTGHRRHLSDLF